MAKPFVFSDESINSYGFYLKNDGGDVSLYEKNPILLWMHQRGQRLPLGTAKDIHFNDEQQRWEGTPEFDLDDDFAAEVARKWEAGILRMTSAGVKVLKWSADPKFKKEGQTRETALKWQLKEISIVDIGSNSNALQLYDNDDNLVDLSDGGNNPAKLLNLNNREMEVITLADGTKLENVEDVQALFDKNAENEQTITTLTAERDQLKTENDGYKTAEEEARKAEATQLMDEAVKDGRIDATPNEGGESGREPWQKFFDTNHDGAKAALAAIPKRQKVAENLSDEAKTEREQLEKLSWEQLDSSGKLETVKEKYEDLYDSKFEEKFGKKPEKKS